MADERSAFLQLRRAIRTRVDTGPTVSVMGQQINETFVLSNKAIGHITNANRRSNTSAPVFAPGELITGAPGPGRTPPDPSKPWTGRTRPNNI